VQHSSYVLIERPYFTINPHTTVANQSISSHLQLQTGNYDAGVGLRSESRFEAFDRTLQGLASNMQHDFDSITDTVCFTCEPPRMFVRKSKLQKHFRLYHSVGGKGCRYYHKYQRLDILLHKARCEEKPANYDMPGRYGHCCAMGEARWKRVADHRELHWLSDWMIMFAMLAGLQVPEEVTL